MIGKPATTTTCSIGGKQHGLSPSPSSHCRPPSPNWPIGQAKAPQPNHQPASQPYPFPTIPNLFHTAPTISPPPVRVHHRYRPLPTQLTKTAEHHVLLLLLPDFSSSTDRSTNQPPANQPAAHPFPHPILPSVIAAAFLPTFVPFIRPCLAVTHCCCCCHSTV